jgi:iron complex outermembrane recepter protein
LNQESKSMNGMKPLSRCLALAFGGSLVIASASVYAQEAAKQERIEVTGSNIKRIDSETASPVQVITRKEIERTGASSINDILQNITGAGAGLDDRFTNGFAPGGGGVNLRGLGFNSTLVLVNGRRLPIYPFAQQAGTAQGFNDLQNIPLAAVDRVEVLKDGASAIYGADAVGGVINIILRKDFVGLEVGGNYGQSSRNDGREYGVNLTYGMGSLSADRYNFLIGLNISKQDEVPSKNRSFSSTEDLRLRGGTDRRSSYGYPGTFVDTSTGDTLYGNGCGPTSQLSGSSVRAGFCRYDRPQFGSLLPKNEKLGVSSRLNFAITPEITAFGEVLFTRDKFSSSGWPAGTTDDVGLGSNIIPAGSPVNPFPNDTEVRYRFQDVGNRGNAGTSDTSRLVLGAKGTTIGWDWEAALNLNQIKINNTATNNALNTRTLCLTNPAAAASYAAGGDPLGNGTLAQIFAANPAYATYFRNELAKCATAFAQFGYYDYLNPQNNVSGVANYLRHDASRKGDSKLNGFDIKGSRELMPLDGGSLAIAVGAESRREKVSDVPDIQLQTGDTLAISAAQAFGERTVSAVYAELNAPFTKALEASLAVRYDKYSGNGNFASTSPKLGLRYQPNKTILLRGTASEAFRAPSLFETTPAQQTAFTFGITDPVLCPAGSDTNTNPNCNLDIRRVQQGNPNLKPEKSRAYTLGLVVEPTESVSVSLDFWRVERKDEIGAFADQLLVNLFPNNPAIVVRNSAGQITQLNSVPVQLNKTSTDGTDLELRFRNNLGELGKLTTKIGGTYIRSYKFSTLGDDGLPITQEFNGTYNQPRWRGSWDIALARGAWEYSLSGYAVGEYNGLGRTRIVGGYDIWNGGIQYTGVKNLTVRFQVNNLLDRKPPFDDETNGSTAGYNVSFSEPMGRFYRISTQYKFW